SPSIYSSHNSITRNSHHYKCHFIKISSFLINIFIISHQLSFVNLQIKETQFSYYRYLSIWFYLWYTMYKICKKVGNSPMTKPINIIIYGDACSGTSTILKNIHTKLTELDTIKNLKIKIDDDYYLSKNWSQITEKKPLAPIVIKDYAETWS